MTSTEGGRGRGGEGEGVTVAVADMANSSAMGCARRGLAREDRKMGHAN